MILAGRLNCNRCPPLFSWFFEVLPPPRCVQEFDKTGKVDDDLLCKLHECIHSKAFSHNMVGISAPLDLLAAVACKFHNLLSAGAV